jgi:hypothetical protein
MIEKEISIRNNSKYDTFTKETIKNKLDEHFLNKFFKDVNKDNIFLEKNNRTNISLKIVKDKNYYFDFFLEAKLESSLNVIYLAVKFTVVDQKGLKEVFIINQQETFDELFVALNKKMRYYLFQNIY